MFTLFPSVLAVTPVFQLTECGVIKRFSQWVSTSTLPKPGQPFEWKPGHLIYGAWSLWSHTSRTERQQPGRLSSSHFQGRIPTHGKDPVVYVRVRWIMETPNWHQRALSLQNVEAGHQPKERKGSPHNTTIETFSFAQAVFPSVLRSWTTLLLSFLCPVKTQWFFPIIIIITEDF